MTPMAVQFLAAAIVASTLCVLTSGQATEVQAATTEAPPKSFRCIVCDDSKDDHCEPWDRFSHSKDCYNDSRLNKDLPMGCRKMVQSINDKVYVSRQCTNLVDDSIQGCIERVGTKRIKVKYCHCRDQECNAASRQFAPATWALQLLSLACLAGLLRR